MWNRLPRSSRERSDRGRLRSVPRAPILLLIGLGLSLPAAAQATAEEAGTPDPLSLAQEITSRDRFQTELPGPTPDPEGPSVSWALGPLARLLLLALLVAVLALLAGWLSGAWRNWRRLPDEARTTVTEATRADDRSGLPDPHRLAERGLHAEAIHALLQHVIRRLAARTGVEPRRSLTSRELLRVFPLEPPQERAMADLVLAVELSRFGGVSSDAGDFARALRGFRLVAGEDAA